MKQGYYPPPPPPQPAQQQAYHNQPTQQNYQQAYQPQPQYRTQPRQKAKQSERRNILLLISSIIGIVYAIILTIYFIGVYNQSIMGVIAFRLVTPHIILVGLAAVANGLSWYLDNGWVALASAVLYLVAGLVFTMYLLYILIPVVLAFVGFVMVNNKQQRDNQPAQLSSNQRFRTQVTPKTKIVYNKRLIMIVSAVMVVIALGVGTVFAIKGNNKPAVQQNAQTASSIVQKFVNAGLPVVNVINYTEETDENNLLGRPNSYTSKTSFADSRLEQFGSDPKGGTVEVFNNKADATSRNEYVSAFSGSVFGMYIFQSDNVLLRISLELTSAQAEEYKTVMLSK